MRFTMNKPDWFLLVHDWVIKRGMTGLSVPFLVGARARRLGSEAGTVEDAKQVLSEIVANPVNGYIAEFRWCTFLKTYVVGLKSTGQEQMFGQIFTSPSTGANAVVVQSDLCKKWGQDMKSIIDHVVEEVRDPIEKGLYSRSHSTGEMKWQRFDERDLQRIDQALGI
jgi:hypothetical protein